MSPSSFGTVGETEFLRFKVTSASFVWFQDKQFCRTLAAKIATCKKFYFPYPCLPLLKHDVDPVALSMG
jgi:hypothetical protein